MKLGFTIPAAVCFVLLVPGICLAGENATEAEKRIGDVITSFDSPGPRPTGLTWDGEALWLAEKKTGKLYRIDPETQKILKTFPSPAIEPSGLAWGNGFLYCADLFTSAIFVLDAENGNVVTRIRPTAFGLGGGGGIYRLRHPADLVWSGRKLWICDPENRIVVASSAGGQVTDLIAEPSVGLSGIAVMDGYFWIADRLRDCIVLVTEEGKVLVELPSPGPHPTGMAWDGKHLWVADYETDKIYKLCITGGNPVRLGPVQEVEMELCARVFNTDDNQSITSADVFFPIPKDLPTQKILENPVFDPPASEIVTDQWGQKIARVHLENIEPESFACASMTVKAAIREMRIVIIPSSVGNRSEIPQDAKKLYLADDEMYEISHPDVKEAVKECFGNETNLYVGLRSCIEYLTSNIEFNLDGRWDTASQVLRQKHGSCSEFTYVFIAMMRSWGIPTRYVGGTLQRGDIASRDTKFHRWPEVYIPPYGWVPAEASVIPRFQWQMADFIGCVGDGALITTVGGGNSKYIKWTYFAHLDNVEPKEVDAYLSTSAEWQPLKKK
ncbi:MAG: transglutaminase domain-containing protein [Planctomycetota bacterium]|jgi:sugar lactone lactonase YvrE